MFPLPRIEIQKKYKHGKNFTRTARVSVPLRFSVGSSFSARIALQIMPELPTSSNMLTAFSRSVNAQTMGHWGHGGVKAATATGKMHGDDIAAALGAAK